MRSLRGKIGGSANILGRVDVLSVTEEVNRSKEIGTYSKWRGEDRFEIGDYTRKNVNLAALQKDK